MNDERGNEMIGEGRGGDRKRFDMKMIKSSSLFDISSRHTKR
jgi:hypothetical protein